jgi:hypothetical protein
MSPCLLVVPSSAQQHIEGLPRLTFHPELPPPWSQRPLNLNTWPTRKASSSSPASCKMMLLGVSCCTNHGSFRGLLVCCSWLTVYWPGTLYHQNPKTRTICHHLDLMIHENMIACTLEWRFHMQRSHILSRNYESCVLLVIMMCDCQWRMTSNRHKHLFCSK